MRETVFWSKLPKGKKTGVGGDADTESGYNI